jgi:hypothetical protein
VVEQDESDERYDCGVDSGGEVAGSLLVDGHEDAAGDAGKTGASLLSHDAVSAGQGPGEGPRDAEQEDAGEEGAASPLWSDDPQYGEDEVELLFDGEAPGVADEPVDLETPEVVEKCGRSSDGVPGFVKRTGERQYGNGGEIEVEGRKNAKDAAGVEAFEGDRSVALLFRNQEAANHESADDEKGPDPLRACIGEEVAQRRESLRELGMLKEEEVVQENEKDAHRAPSV